MNLADTIRNTSVGSGEIALFYLGQAGFCIKTSKNKLLIIDAYLSDACERLFNFKRMMPTVIHAEELKADLYISTHEHADHLDPDSLPIVAKNEKTIFVGSPGCEENYLSEGLSKERYIILREGEKWNYEGIELRAVYADHGILSPLANGLYIEVEGIRIYHAGDTRFKPQEILASLHTDVDIMMAPINGQYENMNALEACRLSLLIKPKIIIPVHFWMFVAHAAPDGKGDPSTFLAEAANFPGELHATVMAPGELLIYPLNFL